MTTTTIDRAEINRRNAQKSTGPRTPEGKNRSRFNAVKHGMTARTLVLPDEDASVLQMRLESWINDLQPQSNVEQALVEQAVHASWKLERADRAEVARLSHIMESVPAEEVNRHREEAAALGRQLFSDRDVAGETSLQSAILSALLPGRNSQPVSRPLDVLDHPEAIVGRLESTAAGCQWLLDRWTELHDILDNGQTWPSSDKVKAIRLLGIQPLDMTPTDWENHRERRFLNPDPDLDLLYDRMFDHQLDNRLAENESATIDMLRGVADRAIARLEMLVHGHHQRTEADAVQRAALLSFDASNEGERLRRYQFSCSRSLFRSLDTLLKIRRSGPGAACEERADGNFTGDDDDPAPVNGPEISLEPQPMGGLTTEIADRVETNPVTNEEETNPIERVVRTGGIVESTAETEPTLATIDRKDVPDELTALPADRGNSQIEPMAPRVGEISHRRAPFLRTVLHALTLIVLFGAAVPGHRESQNEPKALPVDHTDRQNEPTASPRRVAGAPRLRPGQPPIPVAARACSLRRALLQLRSTAPPSAVLRRLTEPSVSNATLYRYKGIDSLSRSTRHPGNLRDGPVSSGMKFAIIGNPRIGSWPNAAAAPFSF